jgi:hypothetical protein
VTPEGTGLLGILALLSGYLPSVLVRFVLLRRPIASFSAALSLFPVTLLTADLFSSIFVRASFLLSGQRFGYVPAFFLMSWSSLFILLYAHCAILKMSFGVSAEKSVSFFRRVAVYTFTLTLSALLSVVLCVTFNARSGQEKLAVDKTASSSVEEEPWQTLNLWNAGVMKIPSAWYVEDSNGRHRQVSQTDVVQHIREALTARPYGRREEGLDFAFELLVYWWTRANGRSLPLPENALSRIQDYQFEALQQNYPDAARCGEARAEYDGRVVETLTVETRSIPGEVVRFKIVTLAYGKKLYSLMVGYPAREENSWEILLDRVLRRWSPAP